MGDEVTRFLRYNYESDRKADPLVWWKQNQRWFPSIANMTRDVLSIQASSVASESAFSTVRYVVDSSNALLQDTYFRYYILIPLWNRNKLSRFTVYLSLLNQLRLTCS